MTKRRNGFEIEREVHWTQLIRKYPSIDSIKGRHNKYCLEKYVEDYMSFLDKVRIPPQVVKEVIKRAEENNFSNKPSKKDNFYIVNEDLTSFALIKPGRADLSKGLRIIYTHVDSPCLYVKPRPLLFEWDPEERDLHLGVELDTVPYGGINSWQWFGRPVEVVGWIIKKGRRREIKKNGFLANINFHIDTKDRQTELEDAFKAEDLDVITGYKSRKELLKDFRFSSENDFARATLYVVPKIKTQLVNDFILGYGHDDKICLYSAVTALFETKPYYPCIVLGLDREEVGGGGPGGAEGKFFEEVLNILIKVKEGKRLEDITEALQTRLFKKTLAICGDVDVGATNADIDYADIRNISRLGYGTYLSAEECSWEGNQLSKKVIDKVMQIYDKNKISFQISGIAGKADDVDAGGITDLRFFVKRGIPTINSGVPVGSLHSPTEIAHKADLYWTIKAYKGILRSIN